MEYKYQTTIDEHNIKNCPPKDTQLLPSICYHYIHENIKHPDNFLPHSMRYPQRFNDVNDLNKCEYVGLSCYLDEQKAIESWVYFNRKTKGKFGVAVGTFICSLKLSRTDGTTSEVNDYSHFNLYTFKNVDLSSKIYGDIKSLK